MNYKLLKQLSKNKTAASILLGISSVLLTLLIVWFSGLLARSPLQAIDNAIDDLAVQVRSVTDQQKRVSHRDIVIIDIDDYSISELGRVQLWPRKYDASVIDFVAASDPKVILLDAFYTEPDTLPAVYGDLLIEQGIENARHIIRSLSTDHLMAESISRAGNVIMGLFDDDRTGIENLYEIEYINQVLPLIYANRSYTAGYYSRAKPVLPIQDFSQNAKAVGLLKVNSDPDGSVRNYTLLQQAPDDGQREEMRLLPSFILPAALTVLGEELNAVEVGPNQITLADKIRIPVNERAEFRLNWLGSQESFRYISFSNVLEGHVPENYFTDKIVLVGSSATGLEDLKNTPVNPVMPGVEVHATALYNVLNESWLAYVSWKVHLGLLVLFALLFARIFISTNQLWGIVIFIMLLLFQFVGYVILFVPELGVLLSASSYLLLTIVCFVMVSIYQNLTESSEKAMLKAAFASYVSPKVVDHLVKSGEDPRLGGSEAEITAFFSDIQSFSNLSEQVTPAELVEIMNQYFNTMTRIITKENGTLDKYFGDAIIAFFGAPVEIQHQALRACVASQKMQKAQLELIEMWTQKNKNWPDGVYRLKTRIGMNTGTAVIGNMGSSKRFNYTMMGDNVNLAARCESGARQYGVFTMVTESTMKAASASGDDCVFREIDNVVVKGREMPVRLYEIVGLKEDVTDQALECISLYEKGLHHYYSQRWDEAIELFQKSLEREPNQPDLNQGIYTNPSLVMLERAGNFKLNPPGRNWSGVFEMVSK